MNFIRIRYLLAAFDRLEFCEVGLKERLGEYLDRSAATIRPPRNVTMAGMPLVTWSEG